MPFISFIYKIDGDEKTYFGKYCTDYISDDHNGLDLEIKYCLQYGINRYRQQQNLPEIMSDIYICVLSLSTDEGIGTFSSHAEKNIFDFYHEYYEDKSVTYIHGVLVKDY